MSITLKQLRHDELHPNPNNTRQDVGDCSELADSIAGIGLQVPMNARANDDGFELVAGWRRWTAIGMLIADGRATAEQTWPVLIRKGADANDDTAQAVNIVENLHRADVTPRDEFRGLSRLAGVHGWTAEQIAEATGISEQTIKAKLKWMVFTDEQLDKMFACGARLDDITRVAKLPQASIDEVFANDSVGYAFCRHMDSVVEGRRRQREIATIRNKLRRAGHLVIGSGCGDEKDNDAALEVIKEQKSAAKEAGHEFDSFPVSAHDLDDDLAEMDLPVPSVFTIEKSDYRIPLSVYIVEAPLTDEQVEAKQAAMSDYERARAEADADYDRRRKEYDEAKAEAQRAFVLDSKTSDLISRVLHHHVAGTQEHVAKKACKTLGIVQSSETLVAFAGQSAADLARAAAACALHASWPQMELPKFDLERPTFQAPNPKHYDDDGRFVGEQTSDDQVDDVDETNGE